MCGVPVNLSHVAPSMNGPAVNSSASFRVDQAILTGESESVNKSPEVVPDLKAVKQDMTNILFSGTTVVNGSARAVVIYTGQKTAIGDIHQSITSQISEKTPLKRKLDEAYDELRRMPRDAQDIVSWNTMIWHAMKAARFKLAYTMYAEVSRASM